MTNWNTNFQLDLIIEKIVDVDHFVTKCNVIPLLRDQNLLQMVRDVGSYSEWLSPEFYTNLSVETLELFSLHYHQVFVRNKW